MRRTSRGGVTSQRSITGAATLALAWLVVPAPVLAQNAYITNLFNNDVSVIDTTTNAVIATIPVEANPFGVAVTPDGSKVFVVNTNSDDVSVIDAVTNMVIGPPIPVSRNPIGVAVTPDGGKAYVANDLMGTVSVIDTATNTVVGAPIPVG
jgi:YVTN family beta-propeller protein